MKKHLETCSHAEFERAATKVSMVSIIGNLILSVLKALAGVIAHSGAMISDAVHSASDVFSSIIVIIGVKISAKESDDEHPYGHERFECVAAIVLSVVLFLTGLMIGIGAVQDIAGGDYQNLTIPGVLSLVAAFISIISKEAMYWYTRAYAERYDSSALMADAWHHRSDALSSVGALIGIAAARMGFPVMDAVASLVICFFIAKAAYDIFKDAIDKMVDHSCDKETESALLHCAVCQQGVLGIDMLHTRVFGNKIYVDIEISADSRLSLSEGHRIAEQVHTAIEQEFPKVKQSVVHVNQAGVAAADALRRSEKAEEKNNWN